jgi:hypothetical protein
MRAISIVVALVFAAACGHSSPVKDDAGPKDAGIDAPLDASCFTNPQTHYEIINACTTAQKVFKPGKPPLLNPDGSLPPLP